jgi:hypothetical protein
MDKHVIRPRPEQPDDVSCGGWIKALPQAALSHEVGNDVCGTLAVLSQLGLP